MRFSTTIIGMAVAAAFGFGVSAAQAQTPLNVRIAWVVPVGNWASILYEKKDLMTHYGKTYTVTPTHFAGTPPMITALASGDLDIADLAYSSFATAVENAGMKDIKFIADEAQDGAQGHDSGAYFVLKDSPIKKVEDLKGKVVADVGAGSAVDIAIRAMLKKHGLETPRDYTIVEAAFPNMESLLESKKADLIAAVQPFTLKPSFIANTRPLFTSADALGGPTQFVVWTAHADYIKKNRAALVDMFEDAIRVTRWLTDTKNHDAVVQIAAQITKQPPEQLQYVFSKTDLYRDPNMMPNIPNLQRAVDAQYDVGYLKQKLDVKPYADLSLVKDAAARIK
ncbi:MAG TPA: ABC transporter substrate-binding protein [Stellaceae bacterium]|jgi:NitT/TauT family transport system substrate-binding protein|nr:ABC transporter substrate-binding protein [Stellaceae bacterium]